MTRRAIELVVAALFVFIVSLIVAFVVYVILPANRIAGADALYYQTTLGMSKADVLRLMEPYDDSRTKQDWEQFRRLWWDDEQKGPPGPDSNVKSYEMYSFATFFLPVSLTFTFDADDKLNGRHRYD